MGGHDGSMEVYALRPPHPHRERGRRRNRAVKGFAVLPEPKTAYVTRGQVSSYAAFPPEEPPPEFRSQFILPDPGVTSIAPSTVLDNGQLQFVSGGIAWDFGAVEVLGRVRQAVCQGCLHDILSIYEQKYQELQNLKRTIAECSTT